MQETAPITARATGFFTQVLPDDDYLWTAGFLNERFPLPVSPLGWTVVQELLEELAFRVPLRYLGVRDAESWPITKLYRGHPYVNVRVFQTLYRPFPDLLLPEDAARYFPAGDTTLRREVAHPRGWWDSMMLLSLAWAFLCQPRLWSPWHSDRQWAHFLHRHQVEMSALEQATQNLGPDAEIQAIWQLIERAQALNRQLLTLHRWSLTHAELWYSLLRRLIGGWIDPTQRTSLGSALVAEVPNKSVELDQALWRLAAICGAPDFEVALKEFLAHYGHRSFSLDLCEPPFNVEPAQALQLVGQLRGASMREGPLHPQEALSRARKALRRRIWGLAALATLPPGGARGPPLHGPAGGSAPLLAADTGLHPPPLPAAGPPSSSRGGSSGPWGALLRHLGGATGSRGGGGAHRPRAAHPSPGGVPPPAGGAQASSGPTLPPFRA